MLRGWRFICAAFLLASLLQGCQPDSAAARAGHGREDSREGTVSLADLPVEAHETLRAIKQGGPFAYPRDGVVFGNFERVLPKQARGYYHEYTVKTPGVHNRGTRRIISGVPGEYYYSADHYQTFKRIRE
ncbi:MAG: ribonuclease domain-containing protein [Gallionella sp.]|jgi:ribonuclease T1